MKITNTAERKSSFGCFLFSITLKDASDTLNNAVCRIHIL